MQATGRFFDGQTAVQHAVQIALSQDRLALDITGETLEAALRWPLSDLRGTGDHAEERQVVLTRHTDSDDEAPRDIARLILDDPDAVAWLKRTRPNLYRADVHSGSGKRILKRAAMAIGAVVLMIFVILPAMADTLALIIPREREVAFGKSVTAQIERFLGAEKLGELVCSEPEGDAALEAMVARLTESKNLEYELSVKVFDSDMVNAFAAPGGQIVVLRGLLDESSGPDAVAAVLAHEIGHVENRDPTRSSLRAAGSAGLISIVLGDFTGGVILVTVMEQLLNSAYSRDAETTADGFALEMLHEAAVSSEGMSEFFDGLTELEGSFEVPEYFASHPNTGLRAERALSHSEGQIDTTPALDAKQWAALQAICKD